MILFLAFSVIVVTLVGQGLTLPYISRRLGVCGSTKTSVEENEARRALLSAALEELGRMKTLGADSSGGRERTLKLLENTYAQATRFLAACGRRRGGRPIKPSQTSRSLSRSQSQLRNTERNELLRLQTQGRVGDSTLRKLERELDLLDLRWPSP